MQRPKLETTGRVLGGRLGPSSLRKFIMYFPEIVHCNIIMEGMRLAHGRCPPVVCAALRALSDCLLTCQV